jgi:hypothetical protein
LRLGHLNYTLYRYVILRKEFRVFESHRHCQCLTINLKLFIEEKRCQRYPLMHYFRDDIRHLGMNLFCTNYIIIENCKASCSCVIHLLDMKKVQNINLKPLNVLSKIMTGLVDVDRKACYFTF